MILNIDEAGNVKLGPLQNWGKQSKPPHLPHPTTPPQPPQPAQPPQCLTTGGGNAGKICVFPFNFDGVTYNGCTTVIDDKLWCSTLTNNGVHVGGQNQWGYCNSQCPVDEAEPSIAK